MLRTMSHEMIHMAKQMSPGYFERYSDFIFDNFLSENDVERIVVAAPIKIGEVDYYMGVMLQRDTQNQRLYLHNVVAVKAEKASSSSQDNSLTNWSGEDESRLFITSILQKAVDVKIEKQKSGKNISEKSEKASIRGGADTKVVHGYTLNKNAVVNEALLEELRIYDPSTKVSADGRITVYHRTSKESAAEIRKTGIMKANEDALFFSSKREGYASDYGDTVLALKIPSTQLRVNDIFEGEVHFDMPLKRSANGWSANVKSFLADNTANPDIRHSTREEEVDSEERKVYNRKGAYKRISKEEYAIISGRIMEDNSKYIARNQELPRYGTARSADYFYLYENFTPGNFGVLKQIKITDANREHIASVEARKGENNGVQTFGSAGKSNRLLEFLETQSRGSNSNNAIDSKGRTNRKNGEISLGESESNGIGSSREGVRNKRIENSLREESYPRTFADSLTEPTKYQTRDGSATKDQPDFTAIENKKEITVLCPLQWIPQSRLTINMPEIKENLPQVNPQLHNSLGIINDKSSKNIVSDSGAKVNAFLIICSNFMWKKLSLPKAEILFQEHMNSKIYKK